MYSSTVTSRAGAEWRSDDSGQVVDRPDVLVSFEELHAVMGMHEVEELEARFLTEAQREAKYGRDGDMSVLSGTQRRAASN